MTDTHEIKPETETNEEGNPAFDTCDFHQDDLPELAKVFSQAIYITAASHYTPAQCAAWAAIADDAEAFSSLILDGWVRIAVDDEGIVGFAKIDMPGHISMLYTAPRATRTGVATQLMIDMLVLGEAMGAPAVTADVSSVARELFAYFGFVETEVEMVERDGVSLPRHKMQRSMKKARK